MTELVLEGILAATVTPFSEDGNTIDASGIARLVDRLLAAGVAGFVPCGSTGEFAHLTDDERRQVAALFVEATAGRGPVIVHTGALTTRQTIDLSTHAERIGATAVMVVPPFYDPISWRELVAHYRAIADAITIPIVAYNIPGASGVDLTPERLVDLATEVPAIKFVKDSSGSVAAVNTLVQRHRGQITVLNGWDTATLFGFVAGTRASIWGAANVVPEACVRLWRQVVIERDLNAASDEWSRLWPLLHFFESATYASAIKAGCDLVGHPAGPTRMPFLPLTDGQRDELSQLLATATHELKGARASS